RAAEDIVLRRPRTSARSDMQRAPSIVRWMTRRGMSERLGPVAFAQADDDFHDSSEAGTACSWRSYSDDTLRLIDAEVRQISTSRTRSSSARLDWLSAPVQPDQLPD